jgi:hypothetical protein
MVNVRKTGLLPGESHFECGRVERGDEVFRLWCCGSDGHLGSKLAELPRLRPET